MSIDTKIINDIAHAIKETLQALKKYEPETYSELSAEQSDSKKIKRKLSNIIYKLYHADPKMAKYFADIFTLKIKEQYKNEVIRLNTVFRDRLHQALNIVKRHADDFIILRDFWVQVCPKTGVKIVRRMYLNCDPEHINIVIYDLMLLLEGAFSKGKKPKITFKFPDYKTVEMKELIRADKIVIYYGDDRATYKLLNDWVEKVGHFLHKDAPLFTRVEKEGVGFAYELSPKHQDYAKMHIGDTTSFGGFMALVIARYLHSWSMEHGHVPKGSEIVQVAEEIYHLKLKGVHKFVF